MFDFDEMDEIGEQPSDDEDDENTKAVEQSPKQLPTDAADQVFQAAFEDSSQQAEEARRESPKQLSAEGVHQLLKSVFSDSLQKTEEARREESTDKVRDDVLQATPNLDKNEVDAKSKQEAPDASANPANEDQQLMAFDTLTSAVLYIVQMELPASPEEVWKREGFSSGPAAATTGETSDLGNGRFLTYRRNGTCIATETDIKRSLEPVRLETMIYQTKAGANLQAAQKIQTWEAATRMPFLQFCSLWELTPLNNGAKCVLRRTIKEFEQFQNQHVPLGEFVTASIDEDSKQRLRAYLGPKAQLPADYVLFSAPATADLLEAVSVGKSRATLQGLLAKRADANHICDPVDRESEMTPLTAAVEVGDVAATKLLLEQGGADPNVVCCQNEKENSDDSVFFTAMDVARKDPKKNGFLTEIEQLLRNAGGVPMSKLDSAGSPSNAKRRKPTNLEGVDPAAFERAVKELDAELRSIRRKPVKEQRALFRKLLLQWHPDKNQGQEALATSVFQWLQQAALSGGQRRNAGGVYWRMGREAPSEQKDRRDQRNDRRERRRNREKRPPRPRPTSPKGTPIPVKNELMTTEMRITARNWLMELMLVLLDRGQNVNQVDKDGRTALFYAVRGVRNPNGSMQKFPEPLDLPPGVTKGVGKDLWWEVDMITFMLEDSEADVNARDKMKMTPLMEATRFGCVHTAELLLDVKADIHARDVKGNTALDIARLPAPEYCFTQEDEWLTRTHEAQSRGSVEAGVHNIRSMITDDRSKIARILEDELHGSALEGVRRVGQLAR